MNLFLWITVSFIIIGFVTLVSMKKRMESKLELIKENPEHNEQEATTIIRWIRATTVWGVVSIFLVVWCFHVI
ncbi:hypothetical protein [Alkalihalobacillus sp. LMS39]|uniref:hypothetical protein n=1 Tax=Alkalihalobacillus sp. LMS39 TaxID=2924032 RepID=UPI001FB32D3D|nr:hypothetical protein [Alkalihalobacillus sp. LMS39]UOE92141.1 hypothetical protein MM271_12800 [Alkalihalobacillus sp. LMS39]